MASKKRKTPVYNIKVNFWETCYKVDGYHQTIGMASYTTEEHVLGMVDAIYGKAWRDQNKTIVDKVRQKASRAAMDFVSEAIGE